MINKVDNKKPFELFAEKWQNTFPPSKPFIGDLIVFRKLFQQYKNKGGQKTKILILGATPELRDLVAGDQTVVAVADVNKTMIKAMTLLRKKKSREKLIVGRWQNLPIKEKYDLIIGDAPLNMLDNKDIPDTLNRIARVLKPNGYFLHRTLLFNPKKKIKASQAINDWTKGKINIGDFRWQIEAYSEYRSYNPKTKIDSKRRLLDNIKQLFDKDLLSQKQYVMFNRYDDDVKMTILQKQEWQKLFKKDFKIVKTIIPQGRLYCRDMPIHVLRVK